MTYRLSDEDRETLSRLFGYVPEPEPLDQMLAAVEAIVAREVAAVEERIDTLRDELGLAIRTRDEWESNAEAAEAKVAAAEALRDQWAEEGSSLVSHAHDGRDVFEGQTLERCARALDAALTEAAR